jgi:hypothetical protein
MRVREGEFRALQSTLLIKQGKIELNGQFGSQLLSFRGPKAETGASGNRRRKNSDAAGGNLVAISEP